MGAVSNAGTGHGRYGQTLLGYGAIHPAAGWHVFVGDSAGGHQRHVHFPEGTGEDGGVCAGLFYIGVQNANTMQLNYTNADCEINDEGIHRLGGLLRE